MNNNSLHILYEDAVQLLKELIQTPSFSKEEDGTAGIISRFLALKGVATSRVGNNVFALNEHFDATKPTLLLNSHHDTVKPNPQYTKDPFQAIEYDGKLYGLGSNDAGGPLVSLIATFFIMYLCGFSVNVLTLLAIVLATGLVVDDGIEIMLSGPFDSFLASGEWHPYWRMRLLERSRPD